MNSSRSSHPSAVRRYRGVCSNKLTIRQDRLEEQLLAALEDRLLKPEIFEHIIQQVHLE